MHTTWRLSRTLQITLTVNNSAASQRTATRNFVTKYHHDVPRWFFAPAPDSSSCKNSYLINQIIDYSFESSLDDSPVRRCDLHKTPGCKNKNLNILKCIIVEKVYNLALWFLQKSQQTPIIVPISTGNLRGWRSFNIRGEGARGGWLYDRPRCCISRICRCEIAYF